jgi:hypothetical protein
MVKSKRHLLGVDINLTWPDSGDKMALPVLIEQMHGDSSFELAAAREGHVGKALASLLHTEVAQVLLVVLDQSTADVEADIGAAFAWQAQRLRGARG